MVRLYSCSDYNIQKLEMHRTSILLSLIVSIFLLVCTKSALAPSFLGSFRSAELQKHNQYRSLHGSLPIKLNENLNSYAQNYAEYLARNHVF